MRRQNRDKMNETKVPIFLTFDQLETGYSFWQTSGQLPDELLSAQNKWVQIRGFLYKTELNNHEAWILAAEPNLKSCCVASPGKKGSQMLAIGNLPEEMPSPSTAVAVEGHFHFFGEAQGSFYGLHEVSVQPNASSYGVVTLVLVLLVLLLVPAYRHLKI